MVDNDQARSPFDIRISPGLYGSEPDQTVEQITSSIARKFNEARERYLLQVFGSYETAKEIGHLYIFEEDDIEFKEDDGVVTISYNFRIRPKTPDERAASLEAEVTLPRDEHDIHEWSFHDFAYSSWIECLCGFRPQNQEDMDKHIPPTERRD